MQKIAHGRRSRPNRPGAIILIILLYGELHEDAADSHRITAIGGRIVEDGRALALEFAAFAGVQASKFLDDAVTGAAIAATAAIFPIQIPRSKHSIATGDVVVFLLLALHGTSAAVIAAALEALIAASRSSSRLSSRVASLCAADERDKAFI